MRSAVLRQTYNKLKSLNLLNLFSQRWNIKYVKKFKFSNVSPHTFQVKGSKE